MKSINNTNNPERMAEIRAIKKQKQLAASESDLICKACKQYIDKNGNPKTPFRIRGPQDIRRGAKQMMEDQVNNGGRFTVADIRVYNDTAALYFKTIEFIETQRAYKKMDKESKQ